ncbi:MAG: thioesterase [Rhodobacterales bacterium CG15_BIG_FIL_POST_REV_8_21_14_020_59_13]|nr:MAG: thioesterase [Rhodobacterales bacterium CG15_BIG_FIL_POST_REV_8_21_14_020_59_13]
MPESLQELLNRLAPLIVDGSPHAQALGLALDGLGPARATMRAPYREDLIGDPETGVMHGGVVTALLDHACGVAAFSGLGAKETPATLDLRIDYMRPAEPGRDIIAEAECIRAHGLIAFVRATAHDGDESDPVATASAAFMVTRPSREAAERVRKAIESGALS